MAFDLDDMLFVAGFRAASKVEAITRGVRLLLEDVGLSHDAVREVTGGVLARERLGSTGIGKGMALPHAKSSHLTRWRAGFFRLVEPIDFGSADGDPVCLMCLCVTPDGGLRDHLKFLARFSRAIAERRFRDAVRSVTSSPELKTLIAGYLGER